MTYKIKIKVKHTGVQPLQDWGLGEGILSIQEVTFPKDIPEFLMNDKLYQIYRDNINSVLEPIFEKQN